MANIFKTTLKKDIIADIANNNVREIPYYEILGNKVC